MFSCYWIAYVTNVTIGWLLVNLKTLRSLCSHPVAAIAHWLFSLNLVSYVYYFDCDKINNLNLRSYPPDFENVLRSDDTDFVEKVTEAFLSADIPL